MKAEGINLREVPGTELVIILPEGPHPQNQLAAKWYAEYDGLKLVRNPGLFREMPDLNGIYCTTTACAEEGMTLDGVLRATSASFNREMFHSISLNFEDIQNLNENDVIVQHELRHAKHHIPVKKGKATILDVFGVTDKNTHVGDQQGLIHLDEVIVSWEDVILAAGKLLDEPMPKKTEQLVKRPHNKTIHEYTPEELLGKAISGAFASILHSAAFVELVNGYRDGRVRVEKIYANDVGQRWAKLTGDYSVEGEALRLTVSIPLRSDSTDSVEKQVAESVKLLSTFGTSMFNISLGVFQVLLAVQNGNHPISEVMYRQILQASIETDPTMFLNPNASSLGYQNLIRTFPVFRAFNRQSFKP